MRFFILSLFFLTLACSGCSIFGMSYYYAKPTLHFELAEEQGWRLLTPPNEWHGKYDTALLPQYFTGTQICSYGSPVPTNNFHTIYNDSIYIYICNPHISPFTTEKTIYVEGSKIRTSYWDNAKACSELKGMNIIIAINKTDVNFDNTSVYFSKDKRKIQGNEIKFTSRPFVKHERLPPAVYNLASDTVIKSKQMEIVMGPPWNFSSFMFIFDDMTCTDYEDAVLVIDGFSKNGEKIPPLKVRMNYYDFAAVPEYVGPKH